jgi:hypothetical protein
MHANHGLRQTFVHVAVDDRTRSADVEQHADERAPTRAVAHFRELGLAPAEPVMSATRPRRSSGGRWPRPGRATL